ncbi:efflux RND transporter periplasmic adaptor subunit [Rhodobacteraceae bacterium NNCM2]|nr:efflux RND transporter periplasmic adaptor subunit [Coraliihabitans acroporae]
MTARALDTGAIAASLILALAAGAAAQTAGECPPQEVTGFAEPSAIVEVAAREPGILAKVLVHEGQQVSTGDVLAELDKSLAQADVESARMRAAASGRVEVAEARLALANERLAEMNKLKRSGAARPLEMIAVRAEAAIAAAELQAARDDRLSFAADLARAEARLRLLEIRAPIDGLVDEIHREVSEFVGSNGDPRVVTLLQGDPLQIDFFAPAACLVETEPGTLVEVATAPPSEPLEATVIDLGREIDAATGMRRFRVEIANDGLSLLSGQRMVISLPQGGM